MYGGSFHLFFVDEDGLLIDYAADLAADEVIDTFKRMLTLASIEMGEFIHGEIRGHYERPERLNNLDAEAVLHAYDFMVQRVKEINEMKPRPSFADYSRARSDLKVALYEIASM